MALRMLFPGSGETVPPQPGENFLRFNFKLWGNAVAPDEALSEIRAFLGVWNPATWDFRVWNPSTNDFSTVLTRASFSMPSPGPLPPGSRVGDSLPSRRKAPPDVDRDLPPPAWFDQGLPIEQSGAPILESVWPVTIVTMPFTVAVPDAAFPLMATPPSLPYIDDTDLDVILVQLVGRTKGRKKWFRNAHNLGAVARVNALDRTRPFVQMTTRGWGTAPFGWGSTNSPVTFSGTVVDNPNWGQGISGAYLNLFDRGSIPTRIYNFQQSAWQELPPGPDPVPPSASNLSLDLDFVNPYSASFSTRWHEPGDGSGLYQATVHVIDKRGNEYSQTWGFYPDNEAPELRIDLPAPNQTMMGPEAMIEAEVNDNLGPIQAQLQIADNASGRYWNDELSAWNAAPSAFKATIEQEGQRHIIRYRWTPGVESGFFTIRIKVEDLAGNIRSAARTLHYAVADTIAPIVQIQRPANGSTHPSGSVTISGRVHDNHQIGNLVLIIERLDESGTPDSIPSLSLDSLPLSPGTNGWHTWSHTLTVADLQGPGSFRVVAYALDTFENESQAVKIFHLGTPASA
jgi:hypothetical protein